MKKSTKVKRQSGKLDVKLATVDKIELARGELGDVLRALAGEDRFKAEYTTDVERFIGAAISALILAEICIFAAAEADAPNFNPKVAAGKLSAEIIQHLALMVQYLPRVPHPRSSVSDAVRDRFSIFRDQKGRETGEKEERLVKPLSSKELKKMGINLPSGFSLTEHGNSLLLYHRNYRVASFAKGTKAADIEKEAEEFFAAP